MSKDVQMTFRVESDLREQFSAAAANQNLPAAQVLRELMRGYIKQVNQSSQPEHHPVRVGVSEAEMRRREAAMKFAWASAGLEGFKPAKNAEVQALRFVRGEIDLDEYMRMGPDDE